MKKLVFLLLLPLFACSSPEKYIYLHSDTNQGIGKKYVVVLGGQSGASTRATHSIHLPKYMDVEGIYQISRGIDSIFCGYNAGNNYDLIPVSEPLQNSGFGMNPFQLSWAIDYCRMHRRSPLDTFIIVPGARGSTGFNKNLPPNRSWNGSGFLYPDLVARTNYALSLPNTVFHSVIWHQGENDVVGGLNLEYQLQLDSLIVNFRHDVGIKYAPFILGSLADDFEKANAPDAGIIQAIIADTPNRLPFVGFANLSGLNTFDGVHFSRDAVRKEMPNRYYEASLNLSN